MGRRKTHEEFLSLVKDSVGNEYSVMSLYTGSKAQVTVRHNICGLEYKVRPTTFLQGRRCKNCFEIARTKTTKDFVDEVKTLTSGEFSVLGEYRNNRTKINIKHNLCGNVYKVTPVSFLMGNRCPKCKSSKGEKAVEVALKSFGLHFETEYTFENCRHKRTLPFDFVLFNEVNENKVAIEFDGEQHFIAVDHFGGESALSNRQFLDAIKTKFCEENNIHLIRIPYWKIDEIEGILTQELLPLMRVS